MSRWKVMSLVLILGLGIGGIVPGVTWWYAKRTVSSTLNATKADATIANESSTRGSYHFKMEQGVLSVIEGNLGSDGKVVATGLKVQSWPKGILDMVSKVEFNSLDEVQSFIDTVNEPLLQE